jgi:hypothetical protein
MSHIEWRREKRRILLPVLILAPFPVTELIGVDAMALVDTGSSVSGLSAKLAEDLQLSRLGKRPLTSAQGEGQVERYAFRVGLRPHRADENPTFPFVFAEVIGIELTNAFAFNALLGMDILGQCDFSSMRNGKCRLEFGQAA